MQLVWLIKNLVMACGEKLVFYFLLDKFDKISSTHCLQHIRVRALEFNSNKCKAVEKQIFTIKLQSVAVFLVHLELYQKMEYLSCILTKNICFLMPNMFPLLDSYKLTRSVILYQLVCMFAYLNQDSCSRDTSTMPLK